MTILLLILKILLAIVIGIICLFVLIVAAVLLLPIEYAVDASKAEDIQVNIKIKVFKIISILYNWEESLKPRDTLKISCLGKRIIKPKKINKSKKVDKARVNDKSKKLDKQDKSATSCTEIRNEQKNDHSQAKDVSYKELKLDQETTPKLSEEIKDKQDKKSLLKKVKLLWKDSNRKVFISASIKLLKAWLIALKPKKCFFEVLIGTKDPAKTGKILAELAMLYPFYAPYGYITGCYDEAGIWGRAKVEGCFSLWIFVKPLVIFLWHKPVRTYLYTLIEIGKDD